MLKPVFIASSRVKYCLQLQLMKDNLYSTNYIVISNLGHVTTSIQRNKDDISLNKI